jgi:hypothetical protein
MHILKLSLVFIAIFLLASVDGQGFDASSLGMAQAYGAVARGVDATYWNPANLALPRAHTLEINFLALNTDITNNSMSLAKYKRYFTEEGHQGTWNDQDIQELLDLIPANGVNVHGNVNANILGVVFDKFGLTVQGIGQSSSRMPKALFELPLKGNQGINREFNFDDLSGTAYSAIKTTISGAYPIPWSRYFDTFSVGANISYITGIAGAEISRSKGAFLTTDEAYVSYIDIEGNYTNLDSVQGITAGHGFSLDLGAAGVIDKDWTVSFSLKNLIGAITWGSGTEKFVSRVLIDSVKFDDLGDNEITDEKIVTTDTSYRIDNFSSSLPTVLHLGVAWQMRSDLLLSADLEQAFSERYGYSQQGLLAVGAEYRPWTPLPLRGGMSFGGRWGYALGLGFGLHFGFFQFDLGTSLHRIPWPSATRGIALATNFKFVF